MMMFQYGVLNKILDVISLKLISIMLNFLYGSAVRCCDGLTRRQALRLGGTGLFGGLTLPALLELEAEASGSPAPKAKACIFLMLEGGPALTDAFDQSLSDHALLGHLVKPVLDR